MYQLMIGPSTASHCNYIACLVASSIVMIIFSPACTVALKKVRSRQANNIALTIQVNVIEARSCRKARHHHHVTNKGIQETSPN